MTVSVNGERVEIADGSTLQDLVEARLGAANRPAGANGPAAARGIAAAIDGAVVPRSAWPAVVLRAGQTVELLTAVQGG